MASTKTQVKNAPAEEEKKPGQEVATAGNTAPALAGPAVDFGEDAGTGMENLKKSEMMIPFFNILQSNSPQCDETSATYNEDARPGMILNSATGELYSGKEGLQIIIVDRAHNFVEWVPRDAGGGFVGIHDESEPIVQELRETQGEFGKLTLENGNDLVETYYLYVLVLTPSGELQRGVIMFKSTQIKKYRGFMTRNAAITYAKAGSTSGERVRPPIWAHKWVIQTVAEKNKKGSFYGWKIALAEEPPFKSLLAVNDPFYILAKEFNGLVRSGAVQADMSKAAGDDAEDVSAPPDGTAGFDDGINGGAYNGDR